MCSSLHWQVSYSWFCEKLSPAHHEQKLSWRADFAKNCLPWIGTKVLMRFREKYCALGRQKMRSKIRLRYIHLCDIHDRDISGVHCIRSHKTQKLTCFSSCLEVVPINQHWFRLWHGAVRQQAIAWTSFSNIYVAKWHKATIVCFLDHIYQRS